MAVHQAFRPKHIHGGLEDRISQSALADCQAMREAARADVHKEAEWLEEDLQNQNLSNLALKLFAYNSVYYDDSYSYCFLSQLR